MPDFSESVVSAANGEFCKSLYIHTPFEKRMPGGKHVGRLAMLVDVRMTVPSSTACGISAPTMGSRQFFALVSALCLAASPMLLTGCKRASAVTPIPAANPQVVESARQQLDLIPPPSKSRYLSVHSLSDWENPYLTVQENMATLHVTAADATSTELAAGGVAHSVSARRQNLTVKVSDLPAALDAVPESSWPYGRVVAIEEAHDEPASARPTVRRNVEATIKTLGDLGLVVYEWNEGGSGLR
jgi:hypothetical protein